MAASDNSGSADSSLAEFIRSELPAILRRWDSFARTLPKATNLSNRQLRDHAEIMLLRIASEIETRGSRQDCNVEFARCALLHGEERHDCMFTVDDTLAEFSELRWSVCDLWSRKLNGLTHRQLDDLSQFHRSLDQAAAESLSRFSSRKEVHSRLFETTLVASPDPTHVLDIKGRAIYVNRAAEKLYGIPRQAIIGKTAHDLGLPFAAELDNYLHRAAGEMEICRGELKEAFGNREERAFEFLLVPLYGESGETSGMVAILHDIHERKLLEDQAWHNANHDLLTGLANRRLFLDRLEHDLHHAARGNQFLAVLFLDLNGFKEINDSLGHEIGDAVLCTVAERLSRCVRKEDTVARIGGDEFSIILSGMVDTEAVDNVARKILHAFEAPANLRQTQVPVTVSIGVALYPHDADNPIELLRMADQAMYQAKKFGANQIRTYQHQHH